MVMAQLTDAHLERLQALSPLSELHVHLPGMPRALEEKLRRALPKCKVIIVR